MPVEEWPDVTAMLSGFGEPSLAASSRLEGRALEIEYEGDVVCYAFGAGEVRREPASDDAAGAVPYRAVALRPGIFFVDFRVGEAVRAVDFTLIVDFDGNRVFEAESAFADRDGAVRMRTGARSGRIAAAETAEPWERTDELVGKRIYYRYSPTEHYEHIYLNRGTFVWHCIRGAEAGLADADPVRVWRIADDLVLLHWSETVMPVESIVAIDLAAGRSVGRMFCWDGPTLDAVHIPFDSEFTILGDTRYPER
ncbi:MoaF protein precursor [Gulosibacter sp. 10]|nr:MoaF protein precursor [Gulosibacter sp. 10]